MRYIVTKEQYTRVANSIINIMFKDVKFVPYDESGEDDSVDIFVDDDEVGWIVGPSNAIIGKKCNYELVIYTDTFISMRKFAPIFRKKLFAKLMIAHFSKLSGLDIDCLFIDETGDQLDDDAFKYRIKKKKKKKKK